MKLITQITSPRADLFQSVVVVVVRLLQQLVPEPVLIQPDAAASGRPAGIYGGPEGPQPPAGAVLALLTAHVVRSENIQAQTHISSLDFSYNTAVNPSIFIPPG